MTKQDVTPPVKPSLQKINNDPIEVKAGPGMEISQEPSDDETTAEVEDTTQKNAVEVTDSPISQEPDKEAKKSEKIADEAVSDVKHSSSKVISELGEDRKSFAEGLIKLAKENETSRSFVKKMIEEDPRKEAYFKTKFGDDYDRLFKEPAVETEVNVEAIREEERIKAKVEILEEADRKRKASAMTDLAERLGFDVDEVASLERYANVLEAEMVFEEALPKAAMLVNDKKVLVESSPAPPGGGGREPAPKTTEIQITPELIAHARRTGRTPEAVAEGLKRVEEQTGSDGRMILSLE